VQKKIIPVVFILFSLLALTSAFALSNQSIKPVGVNLKILAHKLQAHVANIHLTQLGRAYLVEQDFPADGQQQYFILNAKGQLTPVIHWLPNTNKNELLIYNKQPVIKKLSNGHALLLFSIDTRPCVACASTASYRLNLELDKQGKILSSHTLKQEGASEPA
jgi:hypothetical protein